MASDLAMDVFVCLRREFFDSHGEPKPFALRAKGGTQSDPFDEMLAAILERELPGVSIKKAGANTSPDLVVYRRESCAGTSRETLRTDLTRIVGIEVKKLNRTPGGAVARATGMDFNTTPPCGTVRIYDANNQPLDVRGFYLFVCQEAAPGEHDQLVLTALALCDGDVLNADFDFYLQTVQPREKRTRLGTYEDGAVRPRPMVIFPNPLGSQLLDKQVTLVHGSRALTADGLQIVAEIRRSTRDGKVRSFWCYRATRQARDAAVHVVEDPFPATKKPAQGKRGRLRVDFVPT